MSGTLIIKPIQGKLTHDTDTFTKMDPYCQVILGDQVIKGKVCASGGKTPKWEDSITLKYSGEPVCFVELRDKDAVSADEIIGVCQIDLHTLSDQSSKWWPIYYKQQPAGEVLFEISLSGSHGGSHQSGKSEEHKAEHGDSKKHEHPHMSKEHCKVCYKFGT